MSATTRRRGGSPARDRGPEGGERSVAASRLAAVSEAVLWLLVLAVPLVFVPTAQDAFRLPKLMLGEWLALASLVPLALALARVDRVRPGDLWRLPAFRAAAPLVAVATVGLAVTAHPAQTASGLADLWIGAAALVGWSAGFGVRRGARRLERLLAGTLVPASLLAILAALQFHGFYRPFGFTRGEEAGRLGVGALAGNPGDLAGFLALACLVAQAVIAGGTPAAGRPALRAAAGAALALCLYALVLSQTATALAAVAVGSLVLWWLRLAGRRRWFTVGLAAAAAAALVAATVGPLSWKAASVAGHLREGRLNAALVGRLDGWRAAVWMAKENPWTGVGHSAYVAEFGPARLALEERGVDFFPGHGFPYFANAHNEPLEVVAELGLPGAAALAWGLAVVAACAWRRRRGDPAGGGGTGRWGPAVGWGGLVLLAVLSLGQFPFHLATIAFPALLLLAWVLRPAAGDLAGGRGIKGRYAGWGLAALLLAGLALQTGRGLDLVRASKIQRTVEGVTRMALGAGGVRPELLWAHVGLLERAAALDPAAAGIRQAQAAQYLLLGRLGEAEIALRRALALEPRGETYLNLGRVLAAGGRRGEAAEAFDKAVRLDRRLRRELPPWTAEPAVGAPPAAAAPAEDGG